MTEGLSNHDFSEDLPVPYDESRLEAEWTALSALREMLSIAQKGAFTPTYEQSLAFGRELSPPLFGQNSSLITKGQESPDVREYRQRAEAESQIKREDVSPVEIIDRDIEEFTKLADTVGNRNEIQKRIRTLEGIRLRLAPRKYTENQLILRDLFKAERDLLTPPEEGDKYRDFSLPNGRGLRVRLIHPDPPEHSIGADLIYETYWPKKRLVRLALVQYKLWDGEKLLLSQARNLEEQMIKLKTAFCDAGLCEMFSESQRAGAYRLPYCAVFLRPTDKLQQPDSRLISSALHLPVCVALRKYDLTRYGGKYIDRKKVRSESLSHKVFEEAFNINMLGSRWLTYDEVEALYKHHKILEPDQRIVLHAQEFGR